MIAFFYHVDFGQQHGDICFFSLRLNETINMFYIKTLDFGPLRKLLALSDIILYGF